MLINIFNYKGHTVCIRAYNGIYEYIVSGEVVGTIYDEETAVSKAKEYIETLPQTPNSNL
jgi:hypothetical protein